MKENNAAQAVEQDPINAAILLLTEEADSISDCHTRTLGDWAGEPEAKAHYDHVRSVVDALSQLRAPVADERALDLLDTLFTAYESGTPCYEEPDSQGGYLGMAFRIDDDTFRACADLLNKHRPRAALASAPVPVLKDWRIDTSAGGPILVYKDCSVIESAQAEYVLRLIAADQASAPVAGEAKNYPGDNVAERLDKMADDQPPGSQAQSDLYAAATIWRKHIAHRAAPQASAEDVRNAALEEAAKLMDQTLRSNGAALIRGLKRSQADKDGGQQRAEDAERWRWATATDESAQVLYTIVQAYGGDQKKINERADFYRAALSAPQAEQGERDAQD